MANIDRHDQRNQATREMSRSGRGTDVTSRGQGNLLDISPSEFFANPFSVMRRMHDEMDRVFAESFGGRVGSSGFGGGMTAWSPAIEVSERDNQMTVCAELPGLKPEDVKVEVTEDALVIEGERKQEHEDRQGGRWHSERRYGRFVRTIPLPDGADASQARADFKNGELHVTIPLQRQESKRRQIPIGGASTEPQQKK